MTHILYSIEVLIVCRAVGGVFKNLVNSLLLQIILHKLMMKNREDLYLLCTCQVTFLEPTTLI